MDSSTKDRKGEAKQNFFEVVENGDQDAVADLILKLSGEIERQMQSGAISVTLLFDATQHRTETHFLRWKASL